MSINTTEDRDAYRFAVDLVVFHDGNVLLAERGKAPFEGCKVLPGGHVEPDERSRDAAVRELHEETGLDINRDRLHLLDAYDDPDRDPRARVISVVYAVNLTEVPGRVAAGDDAATAAWFDIEEALHDRLGFDHNRILADAYDAFLDERF